MSFSSFCEKSRPSSYDIHVHEGFLAEEGDLVIDVDVCTVPACQQNIFGLNAPLTEGAEELYRR